jgi:hypothetical protein
MIDEEPIKRFDTPTLDDLRPLLGGDVTVAVLEKVRAVLAGEIKPSDASEACAKWVRQCYNPPSWHERVLEACNDLLGGNGVGGLDIEGADTYTDNGVRMCPPFSYVNQGDPYIVTLARDHENSAWVIADWASMAEEYEREHKLGDHEEFDEEPDCCPSTRSRTAVLTATATRSRSKRGRRPITGSATPATTIARLPKVGSRRSPTMTRKITKEPSRRRFRSAAPTRGRSGFDSPTAL